MLEWIGNEISITGLEHIKAVDGPCVFIGNHMSMMETMLLPVIISPVKPVTFVIKESLLHYPVFKHIMRACNPVAVSRTNPRQDLKVVMSEGLDRLQNGRSIIVFPQTTRTPTFDPEMMSSIGVKLAKKADVPVIPLALKTDAWQNGKKLKDFGPFDLTKKTYFSFGSPLQVDDKGAETQDRVNGFIAEHLTAWRRLEAGE